MHRKLGSFDLFLLFATAGYQVPQPGYPPTSPPYPVPQPHTAPTAPSPPGFSVYPVASPGAGQVIPPQPPPRGYREHGTAPSHHHPVPDPHASITPYMPVANSIPAGLEYLTQVRIPPTTDPGRAIACRNWQAGGLTGETRRKHPKSACGMHGRCFLHRG